MISIKIKYFGLIGWVQTLRDFLAKIERENPIQYYFNKNKYSE